MTRRLVQQFTIWLGVSACLLSDAALAQSREPVASPDSYQTASGGLLAVPASMGVLANDSVNGATVTAFENPGSEGGRVFVGPDGAFVYEPRDGFVGSEVFTYRIANGTASATGTVVIAVRGSTPSTSSGADARHTARRVVVSEAFPFTDDPLVPGIAVKAVHFTELVPPLNAFRAAAGLAPIAIDSGVAPGEIIIAGPLTQVRFALQESRAALSQPPFVFTRAIAPGSLVRASDVQETRDALRLVVLSCPAISVTNPASATGTVGMPFDAQFSQRGATGTVMFTLASGSLPAGMMLMTDGHLTGTPSAAGMFPVTVRAEDANACSGTSATYSLSILDVPSITSFASMPTTITMGGTAQLTAQFGGGSGVVTNSFDSSSIPITSGAPAAVNPPATSTYTLTVTNATGSAATSQTTVTVVAPPSITAFTASSAIVTAGNSVQLTPTFTNATGAVISNDRDGTTISATSGVAAVVTPTQNTVYTLTVSNAAGMTATKTVPVEVVAAPSISSFTSSANPVSIGATLQLTPTFTGGTGRVTNNVDSSMLIVSSGVAVPVNPTSTRAYTLTVTNAAGATATSQVFVTVVALPSITSFTAASPIATAATTTQLTGFFSGGTGNVSSGGISLGSLVSGSSLSTSNGAPGIVSYTLTVTNAAGSTATATAQVSWIAAPTASLAANQSLVSAGSTVILTPTFANGTGRIAPGSASPVTSGNTVPVIVDRSTTYTLTVTNAAGTTATSAVTVSVAPQIQSFNVSPSFIRSGIPTTLTFNATFTGSSSGAGVVSGPSLTTSIVSGASATASATRTINTTYTLTVGGTTGAAATATASVTVLADPVISAFTASQTTIASGATTQLTPAYAGGTGVITNNQNGVSINVPSGVAVTVAPTTSTVYTLTVTNAAGGIATSTVNVTVTP